MFMTASQCHWSCSRPLSHPHHWTPTKTPLGYPAVPPSRGDPMAIIKQDQSLHTLQKGKDWVDVKKGGRNTEKDRVTGRRESQRGRKREQRMERGQIEKGGCTASADVYGSHCHCSATEYSQWAHKVFSFEGRGRRQNVHVCFLVWVTVRTKKKANLANNDPAILFWKSYPWQKIIYFQWMN